MPINSTERILSFIRQLREKKIAYRLYHSRDDALSIEVDVPGERWEIDFLEDNTVDVEIFRSDGNIQNEDAFQELFAKFSD